jgi:inner membrane protein YidH
MPGQDGIPNQTAGKDPRVYLAAERTVLAWIRTGLALMGFGFVLARFGIFLRSLAASGVIAEPGSKFSVSVGTVLIVIGVAVEVLAIVKYRKLIADLNAGVQTFDRPSLLASAVGYTMAGIGAAMAIYLLVFR